MLLLYNGLAKASTISYSIALVSFNSESIWVDGLIGFLSGDKKPEVQVDHGVTDTVKYGAIALVAYMVLK